VEFDPIREFVELRDALLAADANDVVSAIERVSHEVAPELSGGADNANTVGMTHRGIGWSCVGRRLHVNPSLERLPGHRPVPKCACSRSHPSPEGRREVIERRDDRS
jgi:hypothetical protein